MGIQCNRLPLLPATVSHCEHPVTRERFKSLVGLGLRLSRYSRRDAHRALCLAWNQSELVDSIRSNATFSHTCFPLAQCLLFAMPNQVVSACRSDATRSVTPTGPSLALNTKPTLILLVDPPPMLFSHTCLHRRVVCCIPNDCIPSLRQNDRSMI